MKNQIINEAKRNELLRKSRNAKKYSGKEIGRWEAKANCKVANTVKDYNKINMDDLWKNDNLSFDVNVQGETGNYIVTLEFKNVVKYIQQKVRGNKNLLEKKTIYDALVVALNSSDVKISCNCFDFKYRHAYQASKNGYKSGPQETRPSEKTNPNDTLGAGCKHVLCVLNNATWIRNVASVINNYVNYAKDNMENLYSRYIFPKIYGMDYNKAVQMTIFDFDSNGKEKDKLDSSPELINLSNALGKARGRYTKGTNRNPVKDKRVEKEETDKEKED